MVIWYMNLYDYMILYVLIFLSVSELICLQLEKRACLGRYACSARCEARVSCWRELCTVFVLEGTPAARMKKIDYVLYVHCYSIPPIFLLAFMLQSIHKWKPFRNPMAVIAMQPGPSDPSDSDCHASARQHVWRNHQPGRPRRSVGCFGLSSWCGPGFPRSPGI